MHIVENYFNDEERKGLSEELIQMLNFARAFAGIPFILTSGYRTPEENELAGGVSDSSHIKGLGVDIYADTGSKKWNIINGLMIAGFNRIGIYDKHVHTDIDETKPGDVIWIGQSQ